MFQTISGFNWSRWVAQQCAAEVDGEVLRAQHLETLMRLGRDPDAPPRRSRPPRRGASAAARVIAATSGSTGVMPRSAE